MASIKTTTLTATTTMDFPFVDSWSDYHYIEDEADRLTKLFGRKVGYKEMGYDSGYWGLLYVGRKPAIAVITKLLDDAGFMED